MTPEQDLAEERRRFVVLLRAVTSQPRWSMTFRYEGWAQIAGEEPPTVTVEDHHHRGIPVTREQAEALCGPPPTEEQRQERFVWNLFDWLLRAGKLTTLLVLQGAEVSMMGLLYGFPRKPADSPPQGTENT